jgi:hypothetical protein
MWMRLNVTAEFPHSHAQWNPHQVTAAQVRRDNVLIVSMHSTV